MNNDIYFIYDITHNQLKNEIELIHKKKKRKRNWTNAHRKKILQKSRVLYIYIYIYTKVLLVKHKTFKFYLEKYRKQNWDEKEYTKENSYIWLYEREGKIDRIWGIASENFVKELRSEVKILQKKGRLWKYKRKQLGEKKAKMERIWGISHTCL